MSKFMKIIALSAVIHDDLLLRAGACQGKS